MERIFEFKDGTSAKFWAISLDGITVTTRYGRLGAAGQKTLKKESTPEKAKALFDKLVKEKTSKGYVEAGGAPAPAATPTPTTATADLVAAKKALDADEPYRAWVKASAGLKKVTDASAEQLALIVGALKSICSDLDEHGSANMDMYGGGKISLKKFFALLDEAKSAERALRNPGASAPAPMAAAGPAKVTLGKPKELCAGKFPNLAMTRGGFLSAQPAADDKTELVLRDPASGAVVRKLEVDGLRSVAVSPDGSLLAIGRWDTVVHVFDAMTGKQVAVFEDFGHDWIFSVAFSPDGKRIAAGSEQFIAVGEVSSGKVLVKRKLEAGHAERADTVLWSPDGAQLWMVYEEKWMVLDAKTLETVFEEANDKLGDLAFAVDDRRAVVTPWGHVGLLDVQTAELIGKPTKLGKGPYAARAAINAERTLVALLVHGKKAVTLFVQRVSPFEMLATIDLPDKGPGANAEGGVAFMLDGSGLVVACETKTFLVPLTVG